MNKKGGMIIGMIIGIAFLVMSIIIAFIVISNVADVNKDLESVTAGTPVINETGGYLNSSGYTLAQTWKTGFASPVITAMTNNTDDTEIELANASVSSAGLVTNATATEYLDVLISYTYNYQETSTASANMVSNFTEGINNVSNKIPTLLLIMAVVLILGVLVLLWAQYKRMQVGGSAEI